MILFLHQITLHVQKESFKNNIKTNYGTIVQYDINHKRANISALESGKTDEYEFLTGSEKLPSAQSKIIQQARFTCSPLGKVFEKQIKPIEDQGTKQVEALKALKSEENQMN